MRSKKKRGVARKEPKVSMWMLAYTLEARLAVQAAYETDEYAPSKTISEYTDALFNRAMDERGFQDGQVMAWPLIQGQNGKNEIFMMRILEKPTRGKSGLIGCFLAPMDQAEPDCQCEVCKAASAKQAA